MSLVEQVLDGYVQIETARLGGRLSNQPEQQQAAVSSVSRARDPQAKTPETPFYKKPGVIVAGVVLGVVVIFAATRK